MAGNETLEQAISAWLEEAAPARVPQRVFAATFDRTRRRRQTVDWRRAVGTRPTRRMVQALGGGAALVLAAVLAINVVPILGPGKPTNSPSASEQSSPSAMPTTRMWPQTTLDEVRAAQVRADAGDPAYTWQRRVDGIQVGQHHPCSGATIGCLAQARDGGSGEIFARFLEEVLGWEDFFWNEKLSHSDVDGLAPGDVVFVRCAAGLANPLYSADAENPVCAPTIDSLRYETVKVNVAQLGGEGLTGIWVVTGWEMIEPAEQAAPPSVPEIATFLEPLLQARIDGEGAEGFAEFAEQDADAAEWLDQSVPLLYGTATGARYERSAFEVVDGPVWPSGRMQVEVRFFTAGDEDLVSQVFTLDRGDTGRLRLLFEPLLDGADGPVPATTENGQAAALTYRFLDGLVTFRAAHPLGLGDEGTRLSGGLAIAGVLPGDDFPRRILAFLADPRPIGPDCEAGAPPADAAALAQSISEDARFEVLESNPVTIGGLSGLRLDVRLDVLSCATLVKPTRQQPGLFSTQRRARFYLLDIPQGSASVLAIAVGADDDSFETVLGWATPVVGSVEFHAP